MALPSRPRFYALICGQFIGLLIVIFGMVFHWCGIGQAKVPSTVTARVVAICGLLIISIIVPLLNFFRKIIQELSNRKNKDEDIGKGQFLDNVRAVRGLIWFYVYTDLALLTYLVHVTGGITGSMFAGVFLMIPYIPLLLRLDLADVRMAQWLAILCLAGILFSFFMSHFHYYEYQANQHEYAFQLAITTVTMLALILPLVELAILRAQEEEVEE
jgi:hypothetical protein